MLNNISYEKKKNIEDIKNIINSNDINYKYNFDKIKELYIKNGKEYFNPQTGKGHDLNPFNIDNTQGNWFAAFSFNPTEFDTKKYGTFPLNGYGWCSVEQIQTAHFITQLCYTCHSNLNDKPNIFIRTRWVGNNDFSKWVNATNNMLQIDLNPGDNIISLLVEKYPGFSTFFVRHIQRASDCPNILKSTQDILTEAFLEIVCDSSSRKIVTLTCYHIASADKSKELKTFKRTIFDTYWNSSDWVEI